MNGRLLPQLLSAVVAVAALSSCGTRQQTTSSVQATGGQSGQFKGYVAIDSALGQRLVAPADTGWFLAKYLNATDNSFSGLVALLGGFAGASGNSQFEDGDPNAMNMLLWQLALSSMAEHVAANCEAMPPTDAVPLNGDVEAKLKALCAWPAASAKTDVNLKALWIAVMGYDAPEAEYTAWHDYFMDSSSPYAQTAGEQTVSAMLTAIFLNPSFLLEH